MMIKRRFYILLVALLLALLSLSPAGHCSEAPSQETVPKQMLIDILNDWQTSNDELQQLLSEQKTELTAASSELQKLRELLQKQKNQLEALKSDLIESKAECMNAKTSLEEANKELQNINDSLRAIEKKKNRIERQRNFWEIVAAALGVFAIVK